MKRDGEEYQNELPEGRVPVRLPKPPKRGWRLLLVLLLCSSLFVAAFALGLLLESQNRIPAFFEEWLKKEPPKEEEAPKTETPKEDPKPDLEETPKEGALDVSEPETSFPEGVIAIRKERLSSQKSLQNRSIYSVDTEKLTLPAPEPAAGESPLVLILCTHGSESYAEGDFVLPPVGDAIYSPDPDKGILAVAEALAVELNEQGIKTIFCDTRHDQPMLAGSYRRAGVSISAILEEFPGVRYVIDLHRDEIYGSDGALLGCVAECEGKSYAQISALVGCDGDGSQSFAWRENLALAEEIGKRLNDLCPGIFHAVTLENSPYNQNLAPHSLAFKLGAAGNSLGEVIESAELLAKVLAGYFKEE